MALISLYRRWQQRRRERIAEEYGNLSDQERGELERLRQEHDPLDELARSRMPPPPQFRDTDRF
jgi:hypothetical protein